MKTPLLTCIFLVLTACGPSIQTSSGAAYIATSPGTIDVEIAKIAAVEPNLHFPARIGVARVVNGQLSSPTGAEAELFGNFVERNHAYGDFVPVSPIVTAIVGPAKNTSGGINTIRRAAARQHLDYILIYEIGARSRTTDTPFALADVTLIGGAFLPTRNVRVAGIGQAALIDVRNGYPYATTTVTVDISGLARSFGTNRRKAQLQDQAALKVAQKLVPDVEKMLVMLQDDIARK